MTPTLDQAAQQSLLAAAMARVIEAVNNGQVFPVEHEVAWLLSAHPGCPITAAELKDYVMDFAAKVQAPMQVGRSCEKQAQYAEPLMLEFHRLARAMRHHREAA